MMMTMTCVLVYMFVLFLVLIFCLAADFANKDEYIKIETHKQPKLNCSESQQRLIFFCKISATAVELNTARIKAKLFLTLCNYMNMGCSEQFHEKSIDNKFQ